MSVPPEYLKFIASDRLSQPTRTVVETRMAGPESSKGVLSPEQERTLRAMLARLIPGTGVDLAGFVMARLASGKGDGWRYDILPPDAMAYREGLDRLAAQGFCSLDDAAKDELLTALTVPGDSPRARWFEEVRGDAVSAYMGHPETLARLGYSGLGVGGANTRHKGFVTLGPNERERWEPTPTAPATEETA